MAATITRQLPVIAVAGNETLLKISYDNAFTSSEFVSSVSIAISAGGGLGSSFVLVINGIDYLFTYEQYGSDLFACLSNSPILIRFFSIKKEGNSTVLTTRTGESPTITLGRCYEVEINFHKNYYGSPVVANHARWLLFLEKTGSDKLIGSIESTPYSVGNNYTGEALFDASKLLPKNKRELFTFPNSDKLYIHNLLEEFTPHVFIYENIPAVISQHIKGTKFYSLPGTLSETRLATLNGQSISFADLLLSNKMFLSWRSKSRITDIYTPQRLSFIAQSTGVYVFKTQKWYTDGSASHIEQLATISANAFQTIEVCCAWADVRTANDEAPLQYYEIWLEKEGAAVSERRRFTLDYQYYKFARYFLYRNTLGVYDVIRTTGQILQNLDIQKTVSRIALPNDFLEKSSKTRQLNDSTLIQYTLNTGYLEDYEIIEYQEFLKSGEVYWLRNGTLIPIQIAAKQYEINPDEQELPYLEFDLELTQSDDYIVASKPLLPVEIGDYDDDFNYDYLS